MTDAKPSPTVDLLLKLRRIDKSGLTVRDILLLYTIIANPGINGLDAAKVIGIENRSSVQFGFARMVKRGLIEDRRETDGKGIPNRLYVLPAGLEFWNDLKL
jgi:DNA-binding MarR family transcriptional regulator